MAQQKSKADLKLLEEHIRKNYPNVKGSHFEPLVDMIMTMVKQKNKADLKLLKEYITKYYPNVKGSHFETLVDIIYMTALNHDIDIQVLLNDMYKGILDIYKFIVANRGNIYEFIKNPKYISFAQRVKDIKVGSNGGMANVGKGEWLISLCSGINPQTDKPYVNIIKTGQGDIKKPDGKNEEIKWNSGKVSVEKAGALVQKSLNMLIDIEDKKWVPFRIKDKNKYPDEKIYNAMYWKAISGEENISLSDDELKQKIINMSFTKVFEKSDSFIMFNDDGKFQRFCNLEEANSYYHDKLHLLKGTKCGFECRANQSNPIALYCHVF